MRGMILLFATRKMANGTGPRERGESREPRVSIHHIAVRSVDTRDLSRPNNLGMHYRLIDARVTHTGYIDFGLRKTSNAPEHTARRVFLDEYLLSKISTRERMKSLRATRRLRRCTQTFLCLRIRKPNE